MNMMALTDEQIKIRAWAEEHNAKARELKARTEPTAEELIEEADVCRCRYCEGCHYFDSDWEDD